MAFDGQQKTIEWHWKKEPPILKKNVSCYQHNLKGHSRSEFEEEVEKWIQEDVLILWSATSNGSGAAKKGRSQTSTGLLGDE